MYMDSVVKIKNRIVKSVLIIFGVLGTATKILAK